MPNFLKDGPLDGPCLILTHGSGSPMDSTFLNTISSLLAGQGIGVLRFEFAYMAARRTTGKKAPPPWADKLLGEFEAAVDDAGVKAPFIGGKSLGARVASMCADKLVATGKIGGLVCLAYPFHPTGRPDSLRTAHLMDIDFPALIVQGERDPFGMREEIAGYGLPETIEFHMAPDGDHDLVPRKKSGRSALDNWQDAAVAVAAFIKRSADST